MKIFRDPIYQYITVTDAELRLVDSPWFQRLRHCSQNGPARLVYPSLLGTRFEHSLGVMELGERVLHSALDKQKHYKPAVIDRFFEQCQRDFLAFLGHEIPSGGAQECLSRVLRMACLCHDLGHFPLSHTFELAFEQEFWLDAIPNYWIKKRACHEAISAEVLRQLAYEREPDLMEGWVARGAILVLMAPPDLSATFQGHSIRLRDSVFNALSSILIGDYDVDRLDYLQRDGRISGAGFGEIDLERFVKSMMLVESGTAFEVMPTSKALSSVETAMLERYKEYKWVVFHHKVIFFNEITVDVARNILSDKGVRAGLFRRIGDTVPTADSYRDEVLRKLGDPGQDVPALSIYDGALLDLPKGAYVLNTEFFVQNSDTRLLDDVWFSLKCRSLCQQHLDEGTFYLQALVDRRRCGRTLWKDLAQFQRFERECLRQARAALEKLVESDVVDKVEKMAPHWIEKVWGLMREEEKFGETTCDTIAQAISAELKIATTANVRTIIALVKWSKLFGRLKDKKVLGRRDVPVSLLENSNLLSRLSGLEGEVPFLVFACGEEQQVRQLDADISEDDLLQKAAQGFIKGIVACWDRTETSEPKRAWLEVTGATA